MRKKIIFRLAFIAVFLTLFGSCRNDYLPDQQETHTNNSLFQLTSKILSLKESRHVASISPGILKAETILKNIDSGLSGKTFNYGNGVSIDTDYIIYIENGPGYHTYTFNIIREGASENTPLENLVLSPLSDGTYREFLFSYSLTSAEKQNIANGIPVDTKGKVSVTELTQGTYNTDGQLGKTSCGWTEETVWVTCSQGIHGQHNWWEWHECTAAVPPKVYTVVRYKCMIEADGGSTGGSDHTDDPPAGGGGDNEGSNDTPDNICNGTGVLTQPQQPGFTDADGCTGIPTQPNLPTPNLPNPCTKIKSIVSKPQIKDSLDSFKLHAQTGSKTERGFQELKSGTIQAGSTNADNTVFFGIGPNSLGTVHTHQPGTIGIIAPQDIMTFLHIIRQQDSSALGNAYSGTVSSTGNYFINFTGIGSDLPPAMTDAQEANYVNNLVIDYSDFHRLLLKEEGKKSGQNLSNAGLEKLFNYLLTALGLNGKITLIREENGNTSTIQYDTNGIPTPNPC